MDMKRILVGTIVGGIVLELLSYLVFELAFGPYYAANVGSATNALRTANLEWAIAITNFAGALLVTLGLEASSAMPSIASGFLTGAVIGLLVWIQADFYYYGATNVWNFVIAIVDPLLSALVTGTGGAVIAAVLARVPKGVAS